MSDDAPRVLDTPADGHDALTMMIEPSRQPGRAVAPCLRILEIATEVPPRRGGISRVVEYLALGLRARGHGVDMLGYPKVPRLRVGEVRLSALALHWRALLAGVGRCDVLHVHGATPTVSDVALLAGRLRRRRRPIIVYTHHAEPSIGGIPFAGAIYGWLHRRLCRLVDETVCTSVDAAATVADGRPTSVIPLGIDVEQFSSGRPRSGLFTVLYVGQFRPWKSVPVLLQAAAVLGDAHVLIAGAGPEERNYRKLADRLGLSIEFNIGVDDDALRRLYERAHVIVVPSTARMEAFGLALLEGMAAGCVPVASDLPGVREVVDGAGFTVEPGSAVELARRLRELRDDPALLAELRQRAQDRARRFDRDRTAAAYEHLFLDLLAARRLSAAWSAGRDRSAAVRGYLDDVRASVAATRVELWLQDGDRDPHLAGSAGPATRRAGPVLVAPLRQGAARLGAMVAWRQEAFSPRDRFCWERAARQAAEALAEGRSGARPQGPSWA